MTEQPERCQLLSNSPYYRYGTIYYSGEKRHDYYYEENDGSWRKLDLSEVPHGVWLLTSK